MISIMVEPKIRGPRPEEKSPRTRQIQILLAKSHWNGVLLSTSSPKPCAGYPRNSNPGRRFILTASLHRGFEAPRLSIPKQGNEATERFEMCRSADHHGFEETNNGLTIRGFYLRLSVSGSNESVPDSLTLVYLPRINGSPLEIAESKCRPDSAAFVTLHRIVSADAVFASRERVRAGDGVRFEVYAKEEKVLKGMFRKDEKDEWKLECRRALGSSGSTVLAVTGAEVCVVTEGHLAMSEMMDEMAVKRKAKARGFQRLEKIPEEREVGTQSNDHYYLLREGRDESDDENCGASGEETEMEMEGFGWAVDVGIWVMCLGVGYLLSRASSKSLRRRRIL